MITIYQIQLTDEQIDAVNAGEVVEAFTVSNRMRLGFDHSKFSEDYLKHYSKGWAIDTDDLEEAFTVANGMGDESKATCFGLPHSASVGDIFVDENGDCFICDNFGFVAVGYYELAA